MIRSARMIAAAIVLSMPVIAFAKDGGGGGPLRPLRSAASTATQVSAVASAELAVRTDAQVVSLWDAYTKSVSAQHFARPL